MAFPISQTLAADGSTTAVTAPARYLMAATGTFGGGTAKVEISSDDGTTWGQFGSTFTVGTVLEIALPRGGQVRVTLTGSTAPSLKVAWSAIDIVF